MTQYTEYQLQALQELARFKNVFYTETSSVRTDSLQKSIGAFVELFCQHGFPDSDYRDLQKRPDASMSEDEWISHFDIDAVLKSITYIIWTNRSHKGYLAATIRDRTLLKYLKRLDEILTDELQQRKTEKRKSALSGLRIRENRLEPATTPGQLGS